MSLYQTIEQKRVNWWNHRLPFKMYHYHIRKTAGTTINFAFLAHSQKKNVSEFYEALASKPNHRLIANRKIFVGWTQKLIEEGKYYYAFSHSASHEIKLPKDVKTITCLRDPVRRILSHYRMLVHYKKNKIDHPCMKIEGPWIEKDFEYFIQSIPKAKLYSQIHMFSGTFNVAEAAEKIAACDFVLHTEKLRAGFDVVERELNVKLTMHHEKKYDTQIDVSESQLSELHERLLPEYELMSLVNSTRLTVNK